MAQRKINDGRSVFYGGRFYTAGQEDELHAATRAKGAEAFDADRLTADGTVSGFGVKEVDAESLAADPTIKAGEADGEDLGTADEPAAAGTAGLRTSEVVHQPGRNAPEDKKARRR